MPQLGSALFVNRWTQAATVVTVAAGLLIPASALAVPPVLFWSLSGLYFTLLTAGIYFAERAIHAVALHAYFAVATTLLFGLIVAARGWAWLIGLPLLSH